MKGDRKLIIGFVLLVLAFAATAVCAQDPLPSWNEGPAKQAIIEFVQVTTTPGSPDFVPPAERIHARGEVAVERLDADHCQPLIIGRSTPRSRAVSTAVS